MPQNKSKRNDKAEAGLSTSVEMTHFERYTRERATATATATVTATATATATAIATAATATATATADPLRG
jgi:hypothetical protein